MNKVKICRTGQVSETNQDGLDQKGQSVVHPGFISLALCTLLASLGTSISNIALPTFTQTFHASFHNVQWITLAYLLGTTTLVVGAGRLGDMLGRARLLQTGILLFIISSLFCALSPTLTLLIVFRFVQGIAAAVMLALSLALVGETMSKHKAGMAMGVLGSTSAMGTALGPTVGGALIDGIGWQAIFVVLIPVAIVAYFLAHRNLHQDQATRFEQGRFDLIGTATMALTLFAYSTAMTLGHGNFGAIPVALLLIAFLGARVFLRIQKTSKSPLIPLGTFRNPQLLAGLLMTLLVSSVMMATLVVGPFYLSLGLDLKTTEIGMVMTVGPLVATLVGVAAGKNVDKFGTSSTTISGLLILGLGTSTIFFLGRNFGLVGYLLSMAVITAGYSQFQAANNSALLNTAPQDQKGIISGVLKYPFGHAHLAEREC